MSNVGVHSFQIPHELAHPTRDIIIVRIPLPPSKIGSILTPDITRDMMQHNVMAGRIVAMGPLAFQYRKGEHGFEAHDAEIGDWVEFRPFAGTMIQGGQLVANCGWRYLSTFNDVIAIIKASDWNPVCEWEYRGDEGTPPVPAFEFHNVKEKVA